MTICTAPAPKRAVCREMAEAPSEKAGVLRRGEERCLDEDARESRGIFSFRDRNPKSINEYK